MLSTILIVLVCVGAVVGAAVGFFKKFTKTSYWGVTVLLTLALSKLIGAAAKKGTSGYGLKVLIATVVLLLAVGAVIGVLRKLLKKAVDARLTYSHYKNMDELEESQSLILSAVDSGDRRQYKKELRKGRKIKDSAGIWGFIDRVLGAASGVFNALAGLSIVVTSVLLFADLTRIGFLYGQFEPLLASGTWKSLGSRLAFDLPLLAIVWASIQAGYRGGISSIICTLVVLAMVVGFGYGSYAIASSEACAGTVEALNNGLLKSIGGTLGNTLSKLILTAIIFLLSLVIIILTSIFLPKLIDKMRDSKAFFAVDGVIGAIVLCAVVIGLLLVFGGVASSLSDLAFMERFNGYAELSCFGDCLYTYNPLASTFANLPIRKWFVSPEPVE